jgi:MFS family permease
VTGERGGDTGWLVALCLARAGASVMSMAFPTVLAAVQTEWGLSNRAAGSISSASQAGSAVSLVVLSAMADYWGPRAVFLVSSAVAAVVALLLPMLAQGQASAFLLFFVMAVVVAGSYTPGVMLIASRFEPGRRGGAVGWFLASSSVG